MAVNQAALFFFNKWLEKYRGYSDYPSDRLDVDVGVAQGLYTDYLENNNTTSLNRAVDIMSKAEARFYNRYVETNAWMDEWHRESELGSFLRAFIELRDNLPVEIHERTLVITRKVANHFSNINKVRNRYEGNTAAEENAWIAMFLAVAANLYPSEPNAANWEKFARIFAYHTITTSGDGSYGGIKTQTVHDDFVMDNTGYHPNCIYPIWTLNYLGMAAAAYFGNKKAVPSEFRHNTRALWNKTKTFIDLGGDRWAGSYGDTSQAADWPPSWLLPCFWPWIYLAIKTDPHYGDELLDWRYKNKRYIGKWGGDSLGYALNRTLREYGEAIIAGEEPWPPAEEPMAPPVEEVSTIDRLSELQDIITPTGSPVQESEIKRQAMIMQLEQPVKGPIGDFTPTEEPLILAEIEPLKERILSLDWWKNNWPWVGVGLVGLSLIITIAKD